MRKICWLVCLFASGVIVCMSCVSGSAKRTRERKRARGSFSRELGYPIARGSLGLFWMYTNVK